MSSQVAEINEPERLHTIAVVDDEEMVTFAIKKALKGNSSYRILTYDSPVEALEALAGEDLDLIISDYLMPHMTGVELLMKVKEIHPGATRIMLTAYADKESVIKAINEVGLYFYLEKPWENEDLRLIVKRGLEKRDLVAELRQRVVELEETNRELQQAREELIRKERLSAIGQMASAIVHDFKGPMTAILGFSELMVQPEFDEEEKRSIYKSVRSEIDRMVDMTNEVLDFTKGTITLQREPISLRLLFEEAIRPLERGLKRNQVEVSFEHGVDGEIPVDRRRFRRVIENLANNAIDAMYGGGRLDLHSEDAGEEVILRIRDTGPGIPEKIRESLFEPFVTHGKAHGTGLGMAIVKHIIEAHGGRIDFETETGKGTEFRIRLPKQPAG